MELIKRKVFDFSSESDIDKFFLEKGFSVLTQAIDPMWIDSIIDKVNGYKQQIEESTIFEKDQITVRSLFNCHQFFPDFLKTFVTNEILEQLHRYLGPHLFLYQSHINFKQGRQQGGRFDWHSDYAYWHWLDGMEEPKAISVIIPFVDHTMENGQLEVLKGSHLYYYCHHWRDQSQWHKEKMRHDASESCPGLFPPKAVDLFVKESISLRRGDVLLMDGNLVHRSLENFSCTDRTTLFLIIASSGVSFSPPFSQHPPRPSYISDREKKIRV